MGLGEIFMRLFDFLQETIIPVKLIRPFERGVRYRYRNIIPSLVRDRWRFRLVQGERHVLTDTLNPGWHWYYPHVWQIETMSVVSDVLDIENLPVTTKDRKTVNISAIIDYEITDADAAFNKVQNVKGAIRGVVVGYLCDRASDLTKEEILEQRSALKRSLRDCLTNRVKQWGVEVNEVYLTHTVETTPLTFFNLYSQRSDFS